VGILAWQPAFATLADLWSAQVAVPGLGMGRSRWASRLTTSTCSQSSVDT